ncbi:MAG: FAD-binding oxidoreductase [Bacteroidia bacterium]
MNQPSVNKYAIIGGGLAGCLMAARLVMRGQEVVLIDHPQPNSASKVAAGLFNVITGRFGAKSWLADTLLEKLNQFLQIPAFLSLQPYVHYQKIYRPFREVAEFNKWQNRTADPRFQHLFELVENPVYEEQIINPHGGINILPCGWIDLKGFLKEMKRILTQNLGVNYFEALIDYEEIDHQKKCINSSFGHISFDHLIFCQGASTISNPFFSYLPIIPNKGELLTIHAPDLQLPFILSKKVYLIPLGEQYFLTGSTYQNQFSHTEPTEEGKAEICQFLDQAINVPYKIVEQQAGVRPTTKDRRPIAGTHPQFPYMHIVSGFGTKGVLLSPYISELMADLLVGTQNKLPEEVHISRFRR